MSLRGAIELIVDYPSKKNTYHSTCLGMTLFYKSQLQSVEALIASHALADSITGEWRMDPEDYIDLVQLDITIEELLELMTSIANKVGAVDTLISVLRSRELRTDIEPDLVRFSTIEGIHNYLPENVVEAVIRGDDNYGAQTKSNPDSLLFHMERFNPLEAQVIGKGSFGSVYRWKNMAIKAIPFMNEDYEPLYESSLVEISALRKLPHNNDTIHLFGAITKDNKILIGLDLAVSDLNGKFTPEEIKPEWLLSCLRGLNTLHSNDIIHSDIKPENILLMSDGRVVLSDFGSCILYYPKKKYTFRGTYNYADYGSLVYKVDMDNAIRTNNPFTPPSEYCYPGVDVWAMGCTFLSLLTGIYAFFRGPTQEQNTPLNIRIDIENKLLSANPLGDTMISDHVKSLILSMLDTNHNKRITAKEAYMELSSK